MTPDPIGLVGMDPNLYGYVLNNPVNMTDVYGLFSIRDALRNPRVTAVLSLGASKLAEYAASRMEPGKARGIVYLVSSGLAFASAYTAVQVSVASYVVAATTSPTVAGAVVGYSVGTIFAGMAIYDIHLSSEYFQKAIQEFAYEVPKDNNLCE